MSTDKTKVEIPATVEIPTTVQLPLPSAIEPKTTEEEQRITAGQRKVNLIWEYTQATVAGLVTITTLAVSIILVFKGLHAESLQMMSNAFFLIIGFYFGRTNHQRIGGVGINKYEGR